VLIEGPYGRLSDRARSRQRILLIGAGVGITPLRSLAEGLAYTPGEALLIQRYTDEPLFSGELEILAAARGLQVIFLPRRRRRADSVLGPLAGPDELAALRTWVPDLAGREVYLCGPPAWTAGAVALCVGAGVPRDHIHTESFGW
jgi:ferredoxin-NADP reductase